MKNWCMFLLNNNRNHICEVKFNNQIWSWGLFRSPTINCLIYLYILYLYIYVKALHFTQQPTIYLTWVTWIVPYVHSILTAFSGPLLIACFDHFLVCIKHFSAYCHSPNSFRCNPHLQHPSGVPDTTNIREPKSVLPSSADVCHTLCLHLGYLPLWW